MKERKTKAQRHLGIIETAASKLAASSFRMKPDNHRHHHVQMVFHDDAGVCVYAKLLLPWLLVAVSPYKLPSEAPIRRSFFAPNHVHQDDNTH